MPPPLVEPAARTLARPPRRPLAALAALLALAAAGTAAALTVTPPAPRPATAPAPEFSADRAYAHVRTIGTEPHVAGSPAADRVRDHVAGVLGGLGLRVEVQDTVGPAAGEPGPGTTVARVRNVVAILPGSAPTGRVFLTAHYDSVQLGPGANDDGAGVATILEVARALAAGPRPRNDIVFVLTDAEEACLCGAAAFAASHPLAADRGVVLNLEARGSRGPVIMFETSRNNAALVDVFARAAPHPVATSFAVEVYRLLPNDTDLTAFLAAGFTGLNSAYLDGGAVYHTPLDTPAAMDRGSLQHHGDNALGVARALAGTDLRSLRGDGDATYFPVLGLLVRYPSALIWPVALLALLAVGLLAWLCRRRGLLSWPRLGGAFTLGLLPLLLAPLGVQALWAGITALRPGYATLLDPYRPLWYRLSAVLLTAAVLLFWYTLSRRRFGPAAMAVGALGWLAALGLVLAAVVPGGSYLAALPALAGSIGGTVAVLLGRRAGGVAAVTLGAVLSALVLVPAVVLLFPALGMRTGGAAAVLLTLFGFAALPVLDLLHPEAGGQRGMAALRARRGGGLPTAVALLAAVGCAIVGLRVDRFDAAHPVPTHLMYALDSDTGRAQWLSRETDPQPWTADYVHGPADVGSSFPLLAGPLRAGPAEVAPLAGPSLTVLSDTAGGDVRTLRVLIAPRRSVRLLAVYVDGRSASVDQAVVGGYRLPVDRMGDGRWSLALVFHAPPSRGVELLLVLRPPVVGGDGSGRVRLRVVDGSDGLAGLPGFRARPPDVGVAGSHSSDLVLVGRTEVVPPPRGG